MIHKEISRLILYREFGADSIIANLAAVFEDFERGAQPETLIPRVYREVKRLLDLSTAYAFDGNLWRCYLTFLLATNENSFTLTCERAGIDEGSVSVFALNDFRVFKRLFDFDFSDIEHALSTDCFTVLTHYRAVKKRERVYNKSVSDKILRLCAQIEAARDERGVYDVLTAFYKDVGVGLTGLNRAFYAKEKGERIELLPIYNMDSVALSDLVGCEAQKKALIANTEAFVRGLPANNVLLYGDSGTGKSTCIKAVINRYADDGLKMIELYKHQFKALSTIISQIKNRNYRFIIYMDDLSFEDFETEYKFLKAVIEGGVESRPDNVLIYATSNRRHLIRETWSDRDDAGLRGDVHTSDSMQEKLSLASRFGVTIGFFAPTRKEYHDIVRALAKRQGVAMPEEALLKAADAWELRNGGISGRTAQQFIDKLSGEGS